MTSSPIEEREEEDGWEEISTQESSFRSRAGTPVDLDMFPVFLTIPLLENCALCLREGGLFDSRSFDGGDMLGLEGGALDSEAVKME